MVTHDTYLPIFEAYVDEDVRPLFNPDSTSFNGNYRNSKAAVYGGSDEELKRQLDAFRDFPGSLKAFGSKGRSYLTIPQAYQNDQNQIFIYQQDVLTFMMRQFPDGLFRDRLDTRLVQYILGDYMKYKEEQLIGVCELIPYNNEVFRNLNNQLEMTIRVPTGNITWNATSSESIGRVVDKLREFCPNMKTIEVEQLIRRFLIETNTSDRARYVFHTMIKYFARKTKHRGIFIPYDRTKHCILMADVFLELLQWMISVKGIFQVLRKNDWDEFLQLFDAFGTGFKNKTPGAPRLIEVKQAERVKRHIKDEFNRKFQRRMIYMLGVRPINQSAFDLFDLDQQIKDMFLVKFLPDILCCTKCVFNSMQNRGEVFRTCDMYEALKQSQILAFFEFYPDLAKWLTSQGISVGACP